MYAAEVFVKLYRTINTPCDAKMLLKLYCTDYCTYTHVHKESVLHCDFRFYLVLIFPDKN